MELLDRNVIGADMVRNMQTALLKETVRYVSIRSPYYKRALREHKIDTENIRDIEDIKNLPLTTREDIQNDSRSFLCVDSTRVSEIVATTGTTGTPLFFALTGGDIARLAENEKRSFSNMGVEKGELVQIAVTMDNLFIAGLAYYSGLRKLGATVLRTGPQNPKRQIEMLKSLGPKVIVAVPSFMLRIAREASKMGITLDSLKLKKALLIGETVREESLASNNLGKKVEDEWKIECFSTYGITEASVAFTECRFHSGLHAHPDLVYAEVLDDNGNALPDGEVGELVLTTFKVEGMPLLRYRTGDITFMVGGGCRCGRAGQRIGPVIGRKSQKLKVKGTTVYPGAIENALLKTEGLVNYQIEAYAGEDGTDCIRVKVGSDRRGDSFMEELRSSIKAMARITPQIEILDTHELEKLQFNGGRRKRITFKDSRLKKWL